MQAWPRLFIGLQVMLLVGGGVIAYALVGRLDALQDRVDEIGAALGTLEAHVRQTEEQVASRTETEVLFLKVLVLRPGIDLGLAREIAAAVHRQARLRGEDPDLALAIISVESNFNPAAVSSRGALGLMQVMPQWGRVLDIAGDLTNPSVSIKYGMQILSFYNGMYKDREVAITAYNRGPGAVDAALMRGEDPHNGYASRVLAVLDSLKAMRAGPVVDAVRGPDG